MWMRKYNAMRRFVTLLLGLAVFATSTAFPPSTLAYRPAYAPCNCTAWAHKMRPDLPANLGNALTWAARAKAQGFPVDAQPRVGDIIAIRPGVQGADRRFGHVAYVTAVRGNRVTVSQMNGGQGCRVKGATFRVGKGVLFIHRKG